MRRTLSRICTGLALATCVSAQVEEKLLGLLRAGDLRSGVAMLRRGVPLDDPTARVEIGELLVASAKREADRELSRLAIESAVDVLRESVPAGLSDRRARSAYEAVRLRVDLLLSPMPSPGDRDWRTAVSDLRFARGLYSTPERKTTNEHRTIALRLAPMLRAEENWLELRSLAEDMLENGTLTESEQRGASEDLGVALVGLGRAREGLPLLDAAIAKNKHDPAFIGPIASALYRKDPEMAFTLLEPVLAQDPMPQERSAYTAALETFYRIVDRLPADKPPVEAFLRRNAQEKDLPASWPARTWDPGYRMWRPDNVNPGKQYAGRHALRAVLPASKGWSNARPPADLKRWGQYAFCFQRGSSDGPIVILYWYGPDVEYWYGHTDRKSGVTGKTARGSSRGGIASLVESICYDEAARELGHAYKRARPLPVSPGVRGSRKAYQRGDLIYDETFFSLGQVTCELLVRVRESDFEVLEPEIRWLVENVRSR